MAIIMIGAAAQHRHQCKLLYHNCEDQSGSRLLYNVIVNCKSSWSGGKVVRRQVQQFDLQVWMSASDFCPEENQVQIVITHFVMMMKIRFTSWSLFEILEKKKRSGGVLNFMRYNPRCERRPGAYWDPATCQCRGDPSLSFSLSPA